MSGAPPGFTAEASLGPGGAYRGRAGRRVGAAVTPALAARPRRYGCGCGLKECCCIVWAPQGDVYACCPRDGSGPCYGGKVPRVAAAAA